MKVIRATDMGMCFGVRDALQLTESISVPHEVTIHGELVHNATVQQQLKRRQFQQTPEGQREALPATPAVLVTAHGISDRERLRLQQAGKQLIDSTCPLVRRAHDAAQTLQADGRHVLVIGRSGHVEVEGLVGDLEHYDIVGAADQVRTYEAQRLGVIAQTTMPVDLVDEITAHIQLYNPLADLRMIDTVCEPTKARQRAVLQLIGQVDAVVVVGGKNSNNTKQLVRLCSQHLTPALHVEQASELQHDWFEGIQTVGLTAGTSTLDETIDEVAAVLERF